MRSYVRQNVVPDDRFGETRPGSDLDWKLNVFYLAFSPKWLRDDGQNVTLTFTGGGRRKDNDSFHTLRGRIEYSGDTE